MTDTTTTDDPSGAPRRQLPRRGRVRSEYQWESIKATLHEMLMARRPLAQIAYAFEVSEQTVRRWRTRMCDEMRDEAKSMEPRDYALEVMDGLLTSMGEAWLTYRGAETHKEKVAALGLHQKAVEQLHQFYQSVGAYGQRGAQPLHPTTSSGGVDEGANMLAVMAKDFLSILRREREPAGASSGVSWDDILAPSDADDILPREDRELPGAEPCAAPVMPPRATDTNATPSQVANLNMTVRRRKRPSSHGAG